MLRQSGERAQFGPTLKRGLKEKRRRGPARALGWGAGLAVLLAGAYFLALRLGFTLLSEAQGVPMVWPASGVATGALIALGRRAGAAVVAGIIAATLVANLVGGTGPLPIALCFGLCNAGEALLTAWLVDRWCGRPFKFDAWRGLWGFLAATALAAGTGDFVAAVAVRQLSAEAALHDVWRVWAAADGLGIVIVAPLLVGLYHLASEPVPRREALEGTAALGLLAPASWVVFGSPPDSPFSQVPPAALFPFLLWIAARCRPVFAAAAALITSTTLVGTTTFHIGQFGGAGLAIPAVQAILLIGSLCTLTLSALFAERRRSEAALQESNERLRLALGGAELGVWSLDLKTGAFQSDERDGHINGHDPAAPPRTLAEARRLIHPDDLPGLDAAFAGARQTRAPCRAEYRVLPAVSSRPRHVRWVTIEGSVVNDAEGRPVRLLGVTRDITERKLAEQALAERTAQLAMAGRAGLVGSYAYDVSSGVIQISAGFAAIYGLPEETAEVAREDWRRRVHPDDMAVLQERRARLFADRQREILWEYRIHRPDGEMRWIEQRGLVDYDTDGRPRRVVGVQIDVTDRKRDEEHKSLLVAELDHRVKNVLAVVSALIARSRDTASSAADLVAALDGRIKSMAIAHELLSGRKWQGLPLGGLIERELAPYAMGSNIEAGGPDVVLEVEAGQAMAMVVHELVTNAAKYGALSVERGRVSVRWRLVPENGSGAHLALDWLEAGGPAVSASSRIGYGTSVIRDLIPYELGGTADLAFPPEGVRCRLQIPARWLTSEAPPRAPASSRPSVGARAQASAAGRRRIRTL